MRRPIKFSQSDFRGMRDEKAYYVDKTELVREVLDAPHTVLLLPRPRRFGKTLNQRMLQSFFDDQQNSAELFKGLYIESDAGAMAHLNRYPTVFLTFKDLHVLNWQGFVDSLMLRISEMIGVYRTRIAAVADVAQQVMIDDLHMRRASLADCERSLLLLTELLFKASGHKAVVLIDEYDHPIHYARAGGFQSEVLSFMRNFMGAALKDNPNLERAVVTGILRIGKESIFSGLNNLGVYTVLERPFSKSFGFTEEEVAKLLHDCDRMDELAQIRDWFNGYRFGDTVIYNPWSILNVAAAPDAPLQAYWINTSGNDLVRELILADKHFQLDDLDALLAGQSLRKELDVNVALRDISTESVWSLLLLSGYLTARDYNAATHVADLTIPNREILMFFQRTLMSWFGSAQKVSALMEHLIAGRMEAFKSELSEILATILSYHDTAGKQPERLYHVFILGLLVECRERFRITSERPAGQGRADVVMLPNHAKDPGIVLEFKAARSANPAELTQAALDALKQAERQDYAAVFRQERVQRWLIVGLAFHGRKVALEWQEGGAEATRSPEPGLTMLDLGAAPLGIDLPGKEGDHRPIAEAKVQVLGLGGVGKTSLVNALLGRPFNPYQSAIHDISVNDWDLPSAKGVLRAHIWDFGVQDIMYATHQLFLSQRSLYLLVLDGRSEQHDDYWLRMIQAFGGESPIIVVINKIDENPGAEINRRSLLAEYPGIVAFVRVSCRTGQGIIELTNQIEQLVDKFAETFVWPESWVEVKKKIESLNDPYISYERFDDICDECQLADKEQRQALLQRLSDLGVILHFPDLEWLNTLILNPKWILHPIYELNNHPELARNEGLLELKRIRQLLSNFAPDRIPYLLGIMSRFELCYPLDATTILIPNYMPISMPELPITPAPDDLCLRFTYNFLPRSLIARLIVRNYQKILANESQRYQWQSGALFFYEALKSHVLAESNLHSCDLTLRASGAGRSEALMSIRDSLLEIHNHYPRLGVSELLSCTCSECRTSAQPSLYDVAHLLHFQSRGKTTKECPKSGEDLLITELLAHTYGPRLLSNG